MGINVNGYCTQLTVDLVFQWLLEISFFSDNKFSSTKNKRKHLHVQQL